MSASLNNECNTFLINGYSATDDLQGNYKFDNERIAYTAFSSFLIEAGKGQNIRDILELELTILENDLTRANSSEQKNSLASGCERMRGAIRASNNMSSYERFCIYLESCSLNSMDIAGLPLDGFRNTVPGQMTSIKNANSSNLAKHFKDFNSARIKNLKLAEKLYKEKQHEFMKRFCEENPDHQLAVNYMSKRCNQKHRQEFFSQADRKTETAEMEKVSQSKSHGRR